MKRFILPIALIAAAGLMSTACFKDLEGYDGTLFYPNAIVTARTSDAGEFYLQLDDETTLKPDNMVKSPYDREVRALVNFTDKGPWTASEDGGMTFDRTVTVNAIDSVRTKDAVPTKGDKDDEVYGTAPISIITNSWTVLEDGYLTLTFCAYWGNPYIYHEINLVTGTDPENPYLVEFRHDPLDDTLYYPGGLKATGIIAFRLDGELADADHLDIKFNSLYGGDKVWTIERNDNYYVGDGSRSRSTTQLTDELAVR